MAETKPQLKNLSRELNQFMDTIKSNTNVETLLEELNEWKSRLKQYHLLGLYVTMAKDIQAIACVHLLLYALGTPSHTTLLYPLTWWTCRQQSPSLQTWKQLQNLRVRIEELPQSKLHAKLDEICEQHQTELVTSSCENLLKILIEIKWPTEALVESHSFTTVKILFSDIALMYGKPCFIL
jgi:hypothetical protein